MTTLNINALTAAQLVALCRRATGAERAAVYAAIIGNARCETVSLVGEYAYPGVIPEHGPAVLAGWAGAL